MLSGTETTPFFVSFFAKCGGKLVKAFLVDHHLSDYTELLVAHFVNFRDPLCSSYDHATL